MELLVSAKLANLNFHGIPWNFSCHPNLRTPSFARVIEIGALQFPCNSMELLVSVPWNSIEPFVCYLTEPLVSSIHWILKWDRIPWNLSFQILMKIIFNCAGWINFRKLINTLYLFASLFHQLIFHWYLHYTICIPGITHYVSKYHSKSLFNAHWNSFWSKSSMELFEQHLNNTSWNLRNKTSSSMEFHGILTRSKVPWNSM